MGGVSGTNAGFHGILDSSIKKRSNLLQALIKRRMNEQIGTVFLVGAGPGDPGLITVRGAQLLNEADLVLYDGLTNPLLLELTNGVCERTARTRIGSGRIMPQNDVNQRLIEEARRGKTVVRLKGGDPFIFGRGGEEIELLAQHRVPFQVVPGITAASGAACYSGIPLTHRDHAQSVRFVTGHLKDGSSNLDWASFRSTTETLVFYMGLVGLPVICEQLQVQGRSPNTPIALVERATAQEQRVITGTLETMVDIVEREKPRAPTLIIVGSVVVLHDELAWFGNS